MSFATPIFLSLLSLALIPLIIHLIQRIRLKKVNYSSLFLLTETKRETFSWFQIKEILLLTFRTLFIFFLFFSLARPFLRAKIFSSSYEASRVIILDDSYSMAANNNFNKAKSQAQQLIKELKKGSEVAILTSSGYIRTDLTSNRIDLEKILSATEISYSSRTLGFALDEAINLLQKSSLPRKEIYIITDLQKRAILPLLNKFRVSSFKFQVFIVDVGTENIENVRIEQVLLEPSLPTEALPSKPRVILRNFSSKSVKRNLSFTLKFSERESILQTIKTEVVLNPNEVKTISFDLAIRQPGIYKAEAILVRNSHQLEANSHLLIEDRRFFTITIPERVPILLLFETPADIQYIKKAVTSTIFEVTTADIKTLRQENLKRYKVIGLFSPANLSYADWQRLGYFLLEDKGLFIALNQEIKEAKWTNALNLSRHFQLEPIRINPPGFITIGQVNYENPIMEIFKGIDLSSAKFYSYWVESAKDKSDSGYEPIAYFSSGTPFLIQDPNKKIIIALTSFNSQTTDFMFKATFLPLVHRLFTYLALSQLKQEYQIDDTINITVLTSTAAEIITPKGEFLEMPIWEQGKLVIKFSDTKIPGFYRVGKENFVVNVLADEGDLTRISEKALKDQNITLITDIRGKLTDLTTFSLLLAILFFILEIVLLLI